MQKNTLPRRPNSLRISGFDYSSRATYFLTISTKNKLPVFNTSEKRSIALKTAFNHSEEMEIHLLATCAMPDHIHLLIYNPSKKPIGDFIRDFKSIIYHQFRNQFGIEKSFWQRYYYDHIIRDKRDFEEKLHYMINNPIKEGLTTEECDPDYVFVDLE